MEKYYLKVIEIKCNKCSNMADAVGIFTKQGFVDTVGIRCKCGNKQKINAKSLFNKKLRVLQQGQGVLDKQGNSV